MSFKTGDGLEATIECRSSSQISFLDQAGRVYTLAVSALPGGRGDGSPLSAFVDLPKGAQPAGWISADPNAAAVIVTSGGKGMVLKASDVSTRLKAGRDFVTLGKGESLLPPIELPLKAAQGEQLIACLSSSNRLLVFPLKEVRVTASGGKGMSFMTLETGESLVSVALVDDRGAIVTGTGRGGKAREAQISKRILSGATLHRARRGKVLALSWKAEHIVGLSLESTDSADGSDTAGGAPSDSVKTDDGLTLEVVDEDPTLI